MEELSPGFAECTVDHEIEAERPERVIDAGRLFFVRRDHPKMKCDNFLTNKKVGRVKFHVSGKEISSPLIAGSDDVGYSG